MDGSNPRRSMRDDAVQLPALTTEGGDAACWLGQLCPDCGAMTEDPEAASCWRCGRDRQ